MSKQKTDAEPSAAVVFAEPESVSNEPSRVVAIDPAPLEAVVIFRDTLYTSRTLVLPEDGRTILVTGGYVAVPVSDVQALAYLNSRDEFEQPQE